VSRAASPSLFSIDDGVRFHADRFGELSQPVYCASVFDGFLAGIAEELFDAGQSVGYGSASGFRAAFRSITGSSPDAFRTANHR
jgi:hypothetical protein